VASILIAAIVGGVVAAGVTLGTLQLTARTNPQTLDLGSRVTLNEDSAGVTVAQKAIPAVVSIVAQEAGLVHASGFLVTSDGFIVTNVSAISNAASLTVLLSNDSRRHDARVVDYDCSTGVAVLKIDQVAKLPTLVFGDSNALRVGQLVVALGGPLGQRQSTRGVVSSLHRTVTVDALSGAQDELSDVIVPDALIDRSNSGGPLLNVGGQVVGVLMAATGQGQPVGFAVPANDVQPEIEEIVRSGQLVVPALGLVSTDITPDQAALRGLVPGALVGQVTTAGPAANAGFKEGDVITALDDLKLDAAHPLGQVLRARFRPSQRVKVT